MTYDQPDPLLTTVARGLDLAGKRADSTAWAAELREQGFDDPALVSEAFRRAHDERISSGTRTALSVYEVARACRVLSSDALSRTQDDEPPPADPNCWEGCRDGVVDAVDPDGYSVPVACDCRVGRWRAGQPGFRGGSLAARRRDGWGTPGRATAHKDAAYWRERRAYYERIVAEAYRDGPEGAAARLGALLDENMERVGR